MKLDCIFSSWGWSSITRGKKNSLYLTIAHMPCFDHGTYRYGQLFPEDAIFDSCGFLEPIGGKSPAIAWILSEQNKERKANN
jgi:hypothetical protein